MPKVSVIITTYNDAKYIPVALAHLEKQTFQDFEVIIVDDGSTDEASIAILKQLSSEKVKVLHKENGHLSSARNFGVSAARAPYILFHDADDYFASSFLEKAVHILARESQEIVAVTCYVQAFGERNYKWRPLGGTVENFLFENECCGNCLVRKDIYEKCGGSDELMKNGFEDWELWIRMLKRGGQISVIKDFLFFYRISSVSMMRTHSLKKQEGIFRYMMEKHIDLYLKYIPKYFAEYDINRLSSLSAKSLFKWLFRRFIKIF